MHSCSCFTTNLAMLNVSSNVLLDRFCEAKIASILSIVH